MAQNVDENEQVRDYAKFLQLYVRQEWKLCDAAGQIHNAEVRYSDGLLTNLIHYLDVSCPGHQEELETLMKNKSGSRAVEAGVTRSRGAQMKMKPYNTHDKGPA